MVSLLEDSCDVEYRQPLAEEMLINGSVFIYSLTPQTGTFETFIRNNNNKSELLGLLAKGTRTIYNGII